MIQFYIIKQIPEDYLVEHEMRLENQILEAVFCNARARDDRAHRAVTGLNAIFGVDNLLASR